MLLLEKRRQRLSTSFELNIRVSVHLYTFLDNSINSIEQAESLNKPINSCYDESITNRINGAGFHDFSDGKGYRSALGIIRGRT